MSDPDTASIATEEQPDPLDPNQVSEDDLENQDWTLGEQKVEIKEKLDMRWKLVEPDSDETIAELIELLQINQGSMDALYHWVSEFVVSPEITKERWEDDMTPRERYILGDMVLDFFGVEDFMDEGDIEQAIEEMQSAKAEK